MFNILNNLFGKKTVTIDLASNVKLTVIPTVGGVNATIVEMGDMFIRNERCYFASLSDLVRSLNLTDDHIIKKLSKAF
jgi:hypothetical protein